MVSRVWTWAHVAAVLLAAATPGQALPSANACTEKFKPISAKDYVKAMNPGWNLGNTLDAFPNEDSWNNPKVVESTFDDVKKAGFKSVRIPVTYKDHYITQGPSWTIDPVWLQRVEDVIGMAKARGLYVLTNMHHDSSWVDVTKPDANITLIKEKFYASWVQIATKLACQPSTVSLEPINEPPATTEAHGALINELNEVFLNALKAAGGYSTQRVVTLVGPYMDNFKTSMWFKAPKNFTNPWALQFHYYNPYDFIFSAWGKTVWGSAADQATLAAELDVVRGNFTDVPLVIGEFSAAASQIEPAARRRYYDFMVQHAVSKMGNTALMMWDNGLTGLDRNLHQWRDQTVVDIMKTASQGKKNALAEATTDPNELMQTTSAIVFHRVGEAVADYKVNFTLNGNKFKSVSVRGGQSLRQGADYQVSGSSIVLKAAFLSRYVSANATTGSKANLTVTFDGGSAPYGLEIIQWDVPRFSSTTSKATGSEVAIPIDFNGLPIVAAVNVRYLDGSIVFEDWTKWLPAPQQGRSTLGNQWNQDLTRVFITAAASQTVMSSGKTAIFTFEFFPRMPGNAVNYTLTV